MVFLWFVLFQSSCVTLCVDSIRPVQRRMLGRALLCRCGASMFLETQICCGRVCTVNYRGGVCVCVCAEQFSHYTISIRIGFRAGVFPTRVYHTKKSHGRTAHHKITLHLKHLPINGNQTTSEYICKREVSA